MKTAMRLQNIERFEIDEIESSAIRLQQPICETMWSNDIIKVLSNGFVSKCD